MKRHLLYGEAALGTCKGTPTLKFVIDIFVAGLTESTLGVILVCWDSGGLIGAICLEEDICDNYTELQNYCDCGSVFEYQFSIIFDHMEVFGSKMGLVSMVVEYNVEEVVDRLRLITIGRPTISIGLFREYVSVQLTNTIGTLSSAITDADIIELGVSHDVLPQQDDDVQEEDEVDVDEEEEDEFDDQETTLKNEDGELEEEDDESEYD
ncbi:uncharacterized protein LOC107487297 [Arachis duranensis]|uniref:Uncharacterized protein LOC107487297 n=1 Tax=Arachis duranensis TaxID=130453 RepID=A0A6P4D717_ARADU|nr:uncharacterized protein LOC107487297 [Arachis duranensis]